MKAAIYNPYWDTLGGGERYTASVVSLLLKKGYSVDIEWTDLPRGKAGKKLIKQISSRFNLDISNAKVVESVNRGENYDFCFWLSDGSIPTLKSRTNILHFQFPFQNTQQNVLFNKMKLFRIKSIVVNSEFTKSFIDREYMVNSEVIYPPVDIKNFKASKKENLIIYIGRFSQLTQSKNQHILVEAFKKMYDAGLKDWKLVLAGGGEVGSEKYLKKLRVQAKSYPISILVSPSFKVIQELYSKARIFWSAVGMNIDEKKDPLKVEHFGLTLVEAMSSGCIPIVTEKGGFKEIIINNENGIFWENTNDLIKQTTNLILNKKGVVDLSKNAKESSKKFSIEEFEKSFEKYI